MRMRKWQIAILISLGIVVGGGWLWQRLQHNNDVVWRKSEKVGLETNKEELIPPILNALTIPYLRERDYASELTIGDISEEESDYTAYLASYQADGLEINGLLSIPSGEMPEGGWPAVVFVHGYQYPPTYQTNGRAYGNYWRALAREGMAVFKIDLRGHGESEGRPSGAYYSADYVVDVLTAYEALQASELINSDKIGLWGHSMAGNILLRALAVKPEIPATVIWAGAVYSYQDFAEYGITDETYIPMSPRPEAVASDTPSTEDGETNNTRQQSLRQLIREQDESVVNYDSAFWRAMAPTNYLSEIKGAIEIHHAVDDETVNVGYSRDLAEMLDVAGNTYRYFEYPEGDHNLASPTFEKAMTETIEFYREYLEISS